MPELADKMFTTVTGLDDTTGILADIGNDAKLKLLFEAGARKQKTKMLAWIAAGMATGKAALMRQLANPLPLVSGLPDVQKREALQNLIARRKVLEGTAAPQAWAAAGIEADQLLPAPQQPPQQQPWQRGVSPAPAQQQQQQPQPQQRQWQRGEYR